MAPLRLSSLCVAAFCGLRVLEAANSFQPLFNGRNLDGWEPRGGGVFQVEDGAIVCLKGTGAYGWLCTKKSYGDFILDLEAKSESGNSGIQIRSHLDAQGTMVGYQIDVDGSRPTTGRLYDEARRKLLQDVPETPQARQAYQPNAWNRLRIECIGDHIRSWVNGIPIVDYLDSMDLDGIIALQVHSTDNVRVRYRNIRIEDLGRRSWQPIWDRRTLQGWHKIGQGDWTISDGAIHGKHDRAQTEFSHLVTDSSYTDFTLRLKFQAIKGNSGLYFRIDEKGFSGVSGFQAEIDPEKDTGGLYETNGRAWVVQPKPEDVRKWHHPGEWNTMTVSAHGGRIAVDVNGYRTAEVRDDPGRASGRVALQLHGGQDVESAFKEIEVLGEAK
jgi:hypothetical protein